MELTIGAGGPEPIHHWRLPLGVQGTRHGGVGKGIRRHLGTSRLYRNSLENGKVQEEQK